MSFDRESITSSAYRVFIFLLFQNLISAQNILPDGGFEILGNYECDKPNQNFKDLTFWYPLDATPDLFISNCPIDEAGFVYWLDKPYPETNDNYAGIWSRWNSNSTYFSEGIATVFQEALEKNKFYNISMAIQNRGGFQGLDAATAGCELSPTKHIDVYLSVDSIRIINNLGNGTSSTQADLVASFTDPVILSKDAGDWTIISTCFQAKGGEKFMGIAMPLGTFGGLPPCAATMSSSGVFRSFYYALDEITVTPLVVEIEENVVVCSEETAEINIYEVLGEHVSFPTPIEISGQIMPGEIIETNDNQIQGGIVRDCGRISFVINIERKTCGDVITVPNIFSPNQDGINDEFRIYFREEEKPTDFQLCIYDRWGGLVYKSSDAADSWEGTKDLTPVPAGTYLWVVRYGEIKESGSVTVIR